MFLPAEALFAEINAYHAELLNYAYSKKVWIAGPTTLISTVSIISMILKIWKEINMLKLFMKN